MDIERKTNRVLCTKMYFNSDELAEPKQNQSSLVKFLT